MKTEKYLLQHTLRHEVSLEKMEADTGINLEKLVLEQRELKTDEFLRLCVYLNITPEEVSDQII